MDDLIVVEGRSWNSSQVAVKIKGERCQQEQSIEKIMMSMMDDDGLPKTSGEQKLMSCFLCAFFQPKQNKCVMAKGPLLFLVRLKRSLTRPSHQGFGNR